jgi:prepilin signal peptidase PulO-like enzyme (type II secretory pathway)
MEINIKYNRTDFEEILFSNNSGNYFKSHFTKKPFFHLIISGLIFALFILFTNNEQSPQIALIVFGLFFIYYVIWYLINARKVYLRRKEVKKYLDKLDAQSTRKLILKKDCFCLQIDNQTYSEKWIDIVNKEIHDLYLFLVSRNETYLIPKKSISETDWAELIKAVEGENLAV